MKKLAFYLPISLFSLSTTPCFSAQPLKDSAETNDSGTYNLTSSTISRDNDTNHLNDSNQNAPNHLNDPSQNDFNQSEEKEEENNTPFKINISGKPSEASLKITRFAWKAIVHQCIKTGRYNMAVAILRNMLKEPKGKNTAYLPQEVDVMIELAIVLFQQAALPNDKSQVSDNGNKLEEAKLHLENALKIYEKNNYKENSPQMATMRILLASVHTALGEEKKAKKYFAKGLVGGKKSATSDFLKKLVRQLTDREWYDVAEPLLRIVLQRKDKRYLPQRVDIMSEFAVVLSLREKHEEAEGYFEQVLEINKKRFKEDSHEIVSTRSLLADTYIALHKNKKALPHLTDILAIYEKKYKSDRIEIGKAKLSLGVVLQRLGDPKAARVNLEDALKIHKKHYGPTSALTAIPMKHLVVVLYDLGLYREAKKHGEQALKLYRMHYGAGHHKVSEVMSTLAITYITLKEYKKAVTTLEEMLAIYEKRYNSDHIEIGRTKLDLGMVLQKMKNFKAAKDNFENALKIHEKKYGPANILTAIPMKHLASVSNDLGEYEEAKKHGEKALELYKKHYGAGHHEVSEVMSILATTYLALKKYKK